MHLQTPTHRLAQLCECLNAAITVTRNSFKIHEFLLQLLLHAGSSQQWHACHLRCCCCAIESNAGQLSSLHRGSLSVSVGLFPDLLLSNMLIWLIGSQTQLLRHHHPATDSFGKTQESRLISWFVYELSHHATPPWFIYRKIIDHKKQTYYTTCRHNNA